MLSSTISRLLGGSLLLVIATTAAAQTRYKVIDLGTLGGTSSQAFGINAKHRVTGSAQNASGNYHAYFYSNGAMTDLGTISGGGPNSYGLAINAAGQITGYGDFGFQVFDGFLYSKGSMTDLGALGGTEGASGNGINAEGEVTGGATIANGDSHAFLYRNGSMTDLGTLGGTFSAGDGINASGQIAGTAELADNSRRAFVYSNGVMTNLGTLLNGGTNGQQDWSLATAINDAGQIVGAAQAHGPEGTEHAFLYSSGTMTDLGTLGGPDSQAAAINSAGAVVGAADTAGSATPDLTHAFLYSNGTMTDLNTLVPAAFRKTMTLVAATGISDDGWIVVNATSKGVAGVSHAYLLQPLR